MHNCDIILEILGIKFGVNPRPRWVFLNLLFIEFYVIKILVLIKSRNNSKNNTNSAIGLCCQHDSGMVLSNMTWP